MEQIDEKASHPKYWMPIVWAGAIVTRARKEKRITSDHEAVKIMEKLDQFRASTGGLLNYDWIPVPLVYTQVSSVRTKYCRMYLKLCPLRNIFYYFSLKCLKRYRL